MSDETISEYLQSVIAEEALERKQAEIQQPPAREDMYSVILPEEPVYDAADYTADDLTVLLHSELLRRGIAGDHINSMNTLYTTGIKHILVNVFKVEVLDMKNERDTQTKNAEDQEIDSISFNVKFTDVTMKRPTIHHSSSTRTEMLTPNMARLKSLNYSAPIYVTAEVTTTAKLKNGKLLTRTVKVGHGDKKWKIGSIPVMVKSVMCHLHNAPRETVKEMQEDPNDEGGYFILRGREWAVDKSENLVLNLCHGYQSTHGKSIAHLTFQSKPGDSYENSFYLVFKLLNDGQIVVKIVTSKTSHIEIPYYLIFRVFGMVRDNEVVDNIVYGVENTDEVTKYMLDKLERAFMARNEAFEPVQHSRDPEQILAHISKFMIDIAANPKLTKDVNAVKYVNTRTLSLLDKMILPHIGSGKEHRILKLRFIGHIIHKLLRITKGVLPQTDRDNCGNKRFHTAGISIGKTLKTQINFVIINEIRKSLIKAFKNTQWSKVDLEGEVMRAVKPDDLDRVIMQSIVTGDKVLTIRRNEVANRVSSQTLYRKNSTNVAAILNNITTHGQASAKSTDRAQDMRMAHNTYFGFIGMAQSADTGEKVGMNKQQAVSASIAEASSSYVLKDILLRDKDVIDIKDVSCEEISSRALTKIFVNGDWIGFVENGPALAVKYRTARRHNIINPQTTIFAEYLVRELYFWTDVGRILRPLIIVYSNINDVLSAIRSGTTPVPEFKQWIRLTKQHIDGITTGRINMDTLREERVIEYVSPEESQNLFIARSLDVFRANRADLTHQYTHVDIEQAVFGIVELSAPNTNHTPASRITMFTNHKKQTCGWFALNHPYRIDKNTFLQYYCETPTVRAFSNTVTYPNSQNIILAYTPCIGYGQEDSLQLNKSSIDLGLFNGSHFYYEQTELDRGERFGNPDRAHTIDIMSNADYSHVDEHGFVREGTVVKRGDVLIVKSALLNPPVDNYLYSDRSIVYKFDEPAIVERVVYPRNDEDVRVAKVKLRSSRPLRVGDKLCLTPDHEVATARGWVSIADIEPSDQIATLNPATNYIEWQSPTNIIMAHADEDLLCIDAPDVSIATTLNHKHHVSIDDEGPYYLATAEQMVNADTQLFLTSESHGLDVPASSTINPVTLTDALQQIELLARGWVAFLVSAVFNSIVEDEYLIVTPLPNTEELIKYTAERFGLCQANDSDCTTYTCDDKYVDYVAEAHNGTLPADIARYHAKFAFDIMPRITDENNHMYTIIQQKTYSLFAFLNGHNQQATCIDPTDMIITPYEGPVHCIEVPNHIFAVRRNGCIVWTGNSSHSGCKGINALMMNRADMPYCVDDGTIPDACINQHSVPTRMVIGQIIETMMGELAVRRGVIFDGTPFRKLDITGMKAELKSKYNIDYGGHRRMYNGKAGNYYDALVFIGPTAYQRLQKFVADENYAMSSGPTCALTRQPLDGRAKQGGLRLGEMEKDVIASHGCMRTLFSKFYIDSDGIDMYICRCGNRAIVNEQADIYKCTVCRDAADIVKVPSSSVANLFFNEINAMGVKALFKVEPLSYSEHI